MSVTLTEVASFGEFGRCMHITDEKVSVYVSLDFGPRVIHCSLAGGENLFWTDMNHVSNIDGLDKVFGRGDTYHIYGGHRLWASPEHTLYSYCPEDDAVSCERIENGAVFTPPPRKATGEQHSMMVVIDPATGDVVVTGKILNISDKPLTLAPWCITQLAPGGVEIVPQSKRETGLLADRMFAVWPYTDMGDKRLVWGDDYITLTPDTNISRAFKIGTHNLSGYSVYLTGKAAFIKRYEPKPEGCYPDGGMSFETYCCGVFIEMETLGELKTIAPGESVSNNERWTIKSCDIKPCPSDMDAVRSAVEAVL